MGRIVRSSVVSRGRPGLEAAAGAEDDEGGQNGQGETDTKDGDGYLDRVAKYVPAEVVAFFIFVNSILAQDVFLLEGVVIVYCVLLVVLNLVVDIAYTWLDRRIRLE